jgi:hypothetical protein
MTDRTLYKLFDEAAFKVLPRASPSSSTAEAFDRLTRDDIVNYYKTHYDLGNIILSVRGRCGTRPNVSTRAEYLGVGCAAMPCPSFAQQSRSRPLPRRAGSTGRALTRDARLAHRALPHPDLYALTC